MHPLRKHYTLYLPIQQGGLSNSLLEQHNEVVKPAAHTLLGMVTGREASVRMIVRMGSTRSMTPTSTRSPPADDNSTLSPTTKGLDRNCIQSDVLKQVVSSISKYCQIQPRSCSSDDLKSSVFSAAGYGSCSRVKGGFRDFKADFVFMCVCMREYVRICVGVCLGVT